MDQLIAQASGDRAPDTVSPESVVSVVRATPLLPGTHRQTCRNPSNCKTSAVDPE